MAQRIRFDNESESVNVFGSSKDSRGDRPRLWRIFGGGPLRFCAGYAIIYAFLGIEYPRRWGYRRGNRRYAACGPLEPSCCEDGGRRALPEAHAGYANNPASSGLTTRQAKTPSEAGQSGHFNAPRPCCSVGQWRGALATSRYAALAQNQTKRSPPRRTDEKSIS